MTTVLKLYEVQFTSWHDHKKSWRATHRRFVFTTSIERAIQIAKGEHLDPVVHQVILRSNDHGILVDPDAIPAMTTPPQ